jgi:hypothetical protein
VSPVPAHLWHLCRSAPFPGPCGCCLCHMLCSGDMRYYQMHTQHLPDQLCIPSMLRLPCWQLQAPYHQSSWVPLQQCSDITKSLRTCSSPSPSSAGRTLHSHEQQCRRACKLRSSKYDHPALYSSDDAVSTTTLLHRQAGQALEHALTSVSFQCCWHAVFPAVLLGQALHPGPAHL